MRGGNRTTHGLQVGHGPAHALGGQLQEKIVIGLQQQAGDLHQSLPYRPVGGLAEISALGVLDMGSACHQSNADVGEGGAGEYARVVTLQQVGEHQPLPV